MSKGDLPALEKRMTAHFREELRIAPQFQWVPPETIPREMKKTKFIGIEG